LRFGLRIGVEKVEGSRLRVCDLGFGGLALFLLFQLSIGFEFWKFGIWTSDFGFRSWDHNLDASVSTYGVHGRDLSFRLVRGRRLFRVQG